MKTQQTQNSFPGPKSYRDFRETGPWARREGRLQCPLRLESSFNFLNAVLDYVLLYPYSFRRPLSMRLDLWSHHFMVNILGQTVPCITGKISIWVMWWEGKRRWGVLPLPPSPPSPSSLSFMFPFPFFFCLRLLVISSPYLLLETLILNWIPYERLE